MNDYPINDYISRDAIFEKLIYLYRYAKREERDILSKVIDIVLDEDSADTSKSQIWGNASK